MIAYLVSALSGDLVPGGIDVALLEDVEAIREPAVRQWMAAQGFGPDDPDECMYLAQQVPEGFPHLRVTLGREDAGHFRAAILERLRDYAEIAGARNDLVQAAAAAGVSKRQISILSGISRQTVYNILEGS